MRRVLSTDVPVALILVFALVPWLWMVLSSFRPDADLTRSPVQLLPERAHAGQPHRAAARARRSLQNLRDSLIVAAGAVALGLLLSLAGGLCVLALPLPPAATRCWSSSWR